MNAYIKEDIARSVRASTEQILLRQDFQHFGNYNQVSKSLMQLVEEGLLDHAGYGIYIKKNCTLPLRDLIAILKNRLGKRTDRIVTINGTTVHLGKLANQMLGGKAQDKLDKFKLRVSQEIVALFPIETIRKKGLSNLYRWKSNDVWCSAYEEWQVLFEHGTDEEIIFAMTSDAENANRLRQSPPYSGLLTPGSVQKLREQKI